MATAVADPHQFSTRPCETCQTVSNLTGVSFGRVARALEAKAKETP